MIALNKPHLHPIDAVFMHRTTMDLIVDFPANRRPSFPPSPRVSFADHTKVIIFENYALMHKDKLWFTAHDVHLFKAQMAVKLGQISSSNMTVAQYAECNCDDTSVFMGLENYLLKNTPREIQFRRRAICEAVSFEQRRQLGSGIYDPDGVASVAAEISLLSRKRAYIIGLLHAQDRSV